MRDLLGACDLATAIGHEANTSEPQDHHCPCGGLGDRCEDFGGEIVERGGVAKITGIAFGWIASTTAFGAVVR